MAMSVLAEKIAIHNDRIKRDQQDLAQLQSLPPQQAQLEIQYRQMRAMEQAARNPPVVKVKTSIF